MPKRTGVLPLLLIATIGTAALAPAMAQTYPTRPVTIVVPFAAGGGNDIMARLLAQHMGRALGQQFVDREPRRRRRHHRRARGREGGARRLHPHGRPFRRVRRGARPLRANAGFDPRKDFAPVGLIASFQQILVVHPSLPVHNVTELLALASKEPGKITYATAGIGSGSHVSTELLTAMADIKLTHVPYRGSGPAQSDLVGGHVADRITTMPPAIAADPRRAPARDRGDRRRPASPSCPTCRPSRNRACPATWP